MAEEKSSRWRLAARIFGVIAVLLILTEISSYLVLKALALRERARPIAERLHPGFKNEPWAATFWEEHRQLRNMSWENYPYGLWRLHSLKGETENVGEGGIRKTTNVKCAGNEPVIWLFGGATMFGHGTPDWETIASNLAKNFADDGRPLCVVNYGSDAWRSNESVLQLIAELRRPDVSKPNMVVFVDSCNDVQTPLIFRGDVKIPLHFEKDWLDYFSLIQEGGFYYLTASNNWTLGQRLYKRVFGENRFPALAEPDTLGKRVVDNYLANMRVVDGLSQSFGFKYDFFWLPVFFDDLPPIFRDALAQTLPLISANAKTNARLHDLNGTYDISAAFDTCHLLPAGTRSVAKSIYSVIKHDVKSSE
jgi:hypothetical protein